MMKIEKRLLKTEHRKAKKIHECNSSQHIKKNLSFIRKNFRLTIQELRFLVRLKQADYKIHPGNMYYMHFISLKSRAIGHVRYLEESHQFCKKYNLYP